MFACYNLWFLKQIVFIDWCFRVVSHAFRRQTSLNKIGFGAKVVLKRQVNIDQYKTLIYLSAL